jgi:hypothetical protein
MAAPGAEVQGCRVEHIDLLGGPEPGLVSKSERTGSGCPGRVSGAQRCGGDFLPRFETDA